ncbi:MAG: hypothetical protein MK080_05955 [Opitutales bacterium]|nr:hypothetical protein [Opitutales bacterium]
MGDTPEKNTEKDQSSALDLSSLKDLTFGPDWGKSGGKGQSKTYSDKPKGGGGGARKDRRPHRDRRPERPSGGSGQGGGYGGQGRDRDGRPPRRDGGGDFRGRGRRGDRDRSGKPQFFKPTVDVAVYPEDEPFKVLTKAIRNSYRTYELFDIARLILEKPERYVVVIKPLKADDGEACFYQSVDDGAVFETEEAALAHALDKSIEQQFEIEEVEVDPPKGNFSIVNRCMLTGELLGPPNYHRYQDYFNDHHRTRITNMPMERYAEKIETVRDEEVIQEWIAKVSKAEKFTLKVSDLPEGEEAPSFFGREEARRYLLTNKRGDLVKKVTSARISGARLLGQPKGDILSSIDSVLDYQRKFPLDTANHLRARLRRLKFNIYKKGSKGVSYVCVVKRKFRDPSTQLGESAQRLIEFIEANPEIVAADLPEKFLGFSIPSALEPATETKTEPPVEDGQSTPDDASEETSETSTKEVEVAPVPAPAPAVLLTDEQQDAVRTLKRDLRWLVVEGFVTEYSSGSLFAPAPMAQPQPKSPKKEPASDEGEAEKVTPVVEEGAEDSDSEAAPKVSVEPNDAMEAKPEEPAPVAEVEPTPVAESSVSEDIPETGSVDAPIDSEPVVELPESPVDESTEAREEEDKDTPPKPQPEV